MACILKPLGDKQLVSTSFLLDYIFKFHPIAFTYRNFELTPELITYNKSPDLRNFIENLVLFLRTNHIREVQNGLFQFKFNRRTSQEINYLSKTSEVESAAFNFSLDESMMVKRHYNRKIRQLQKQFESSSNHVADHEFLYSVGFVNEILGDLHYYDQEFDDAMVYYSNTIQHLRRVNQFCSEDVNNPTKLLPLMLLLRVRLKICLTLEKMKSFATAYAGAMEMCETVNVFAHVFNKKSTDFTAATLPEIAEVTRLMVQPYLLKLYLSEKGTYGPLTLKEVLTSCKHVELLAGKNNPASYSSFLLLSNCYRDIGTLLYYKNSLLYDDVPANDENLKNQHDNYIQYLKLIPKSIKDSAKSNLDYRAPISALIYYQKALSELAGLAAFAVDREKAAELNLAQDYTLIIALLKNNNNVYAASNESGANLVNNTTGPTPYNDYSLANMQLYGMSGDIMAKIGDALLPHTAKRESPEDLLKVLELVAEVRNWYDSNPNEKGVNYRQFISENVGEIFNPGNDKYYTKTSAILHYYISALLYKVAGQTMSYTAQLRKVMYVIHDGYTLKGFKGRMDNEEKLKKPLDDYIINEYLKAVSWAGEITDRIQLLKYRNILEIHDPTKPNAWEDWRRQESSLSSIYNGLAATPDLQEMLCIYYDILLQAGIQTFTLHDTVVCPTTVIDSRFVRIQQLNLKVKLNYFYLRELGIERHLRNSYGLYLQEKNKNIKKEYNYWYPFEKYNKTILYYSDIPREYTERTLDKMNGRVGGNEVSLASFRDVIKFLISDSIFCLHECIKSIQVFGPSHTINYSYLANCHEKMGEWCAYYELVLNDYEETDENKLKKAVADLVGHKYLPYVESKYHNELAILNYYKVMHVHQEGNEYYSFLNNMYYLEDDFNDSLDHFSAAMERQKINSGGVRERIDKLKRQSVNSRLFNTKRYSRDLNKRNIR